MKQDPTPKSFGASGNLRNTGDAILLEFAEISSLTHGKEILYSLIEDPSDIYFDRDSEFPFEPTETVIDQYLSSLKDDELILAYGIMDTGFGGIPMIYVIRHLEDFSELKQIFYYKSDPLAFNIIARVKFDKIKQYIKPNDLASHS